MWYTGHLWSFRAISATRKIGASAESLTEQGLQVRRLTDLRSVGSGKNDVLSRTDPLQTRADDVLR